MRALSAAEAGGECVALAADGDRLWVWSWHSGGQVDTRLAQVRTADVRQLALLVLGPRMFVLTAGAKRVELLELVVSRHRDALLRPCAAEAGVTLAALTMAAAAFPVSDGEGCLAVSDGTAVHVWRCEAAPGQEPVLHTLGTHPSNTRGLVFGRNGDEVLLAGYEEVAVRLWSVGRKDRRATPSRSTRPGRARWRSSRAVRGCSRSPTARSSAWWTWHRHWRPATASGA